MKYLLYINRKYIRKNIIVCSKNNIIACDTYPVSNCDSHYPYDNKKCLSALEKKFNVKCECEECIKYRNKNENILYKKNLGADLGYGLFTKKKITKGDFIIEYVGKILKINKYIKGTYFVELNTNNPKLVVDASTYGNMASYINHRCVKSNVYSKIQWRYIQDDTYEYYEPFVCMYALQDIVAGGELTWNYGYSYDLPFCGCEDCGMALCKYYIFFFI